MIRKEIYNLKSGDTITVSGPGVCSVQVNERRDPSRECYQYRTSQDPRIRALERRGVKKWYDTGEPLERRKEDKSSPRAEPSIFWHTFAGWLQSRRKGEDRRQDTDPAWIHKNWGRRGKERRKG